MYQPGRIKPQRYESPIGSPSLMPAKKRHSGGKTEEGCSGLRHSFKLFWKYGENRFLNGCWQYFLKTRFCKIRIIKNMNILSHSPEFYPLKQNKTTISICTVKDWRGYTLPLHIYLGPQDRLVDIRGEDGGCRQQGGVSWWHHSGSHSSNSNNGNVGRG